MKRATDAEVYLPKLRIARLIAATDPVSEALSTVLRFSMIEIRYQFDIFQRKEPQLAAQPRLWI